MFEQKPPDFMSAIMMKDPMRGGQVHIASPRQQAEVQRIFDDYYN
jgi:hypothetical protein